MKSAKIVNKILLISLAFGSVSVVTGMFAEGNLKKALIGAGATTSVASVAGILATSSNKKSDEEQEEKQLDNRVTEINSQESTLHQSFADETDEIQVVEAGVSSLSIEQNQLWDDSAAELNSEKHQLETKYESEEQDISGLEDYGQDLEVENNYLNSKFENLTIESEVLEQIISPIEEQSFQETSLESETFNNELATAQNTVEEIEEITENITADVNPFANSADLSEFNQSEEISALEMADKLIGTFEPTELDTSQDVSDEESDELFMEDSDLEEEPAEEMDFEAMPMDDTDSDEPMAELIMENESPGEFSFDEPSAIATELESSEEAEMSFESESMDFEAMPMDDTDSDEPMAELIMENESPGEFSFDEPSAIATELESSEEAEMSFESESMDFEAMPMDDTDSDEPMAELIMENESPGEFSFDEPSAIATELESSEEAEMSFESESMDFEAMPMDDTDSDEPMAELIMENESPGEFSFDESSAIATELESSEEAEMSFESESMDFEAMPMDDTDSDEPMAELIMENESPGEFSFDESSAIATELESSEEAEMSFESESMDFEAMSMADYGSDEPIAELMMENESPGEFSFDEQDESAAEFSFDDESAMSLESEEMDFEAIPMADSDFDDFMGELVVDDQSAIATELESNPELGFDEQSAISSESDEMDFEAMLMDDAEEFMEEWGIENESSAEFSFEDSSAIASKADEFMGQFIDEKDSAEEVSLDSILEMSSEPDEFSFNTVEGLSLDEEAVNAPEPDEFMEELVDDNELALNELTFESEKDLAIADNYDSDEFMAAFNDADESRQEFSFEEASTDDSEFNELMGAFSDDSQSSDNELNASESAFNLKFEDDEENYDLDELDSLDAIDKKLDELTEISDDSLGELNDLLGSIQNNTSAKEEELNKINRDK